MAPAMLARAAQADSLAPVFARAGWELLASSAEETLSGEGALAVWSEAAELNAQSLTLDHFFPKRCWDISVAVLLDASPL